MNNSLHKVSIFINFQSEGLSGREAEVRARQVRLVARRQTEAVA